jgi:hypothetical protein
MSTFALLFSELGDDPAAASLFTALGPLATRSPWEYLGEPAEVLRGRQSRALGKRALR